MLLLDEADVFPKQRSLQELERNKLVSIFLRVFKYYEAMLELLSFASISVSVVAQKIKCVT